MFLLSNIFKTLTTTVNVLHLVLQVKYMLLNTIIIGLWLCLRKASDCIQNECYQTDLILLVEESRLLSRLHVI